MASIIQIRRDNSTNWSLNNPILAQGEAGLEIDTNKLKYGDGIHNWNNLSYFGGTQSYTGLTDKPTLNSVEINGDLSTEDLGLASASQGAKADSALQISDIINTVVSTATNKALSANMGKELQDQIDNLNTRGKFLSVWDCATGLATTIPPVDPYTYETGSFFIVGKVGTTNYRPSGATYSSTVPSTTLETEDVKVNDTYYYDGTQWTLLDVGQIASTFANLAGSPYDNTNLSNALSDKWQSGTGTEALVTKGNALNGGQAIGNYSVAEGYGSDAKGNYSHVEGQLTTANGGCAHAEGQGTTAQGNCSHAEGIDTIAQNQVEHAEGQYNKSHKASTTFGNAGNTIHSVGIGTGAGSLEEQDRKNAIEIMQNGDIYVKGVGSYDGADYSSASTIQTIINGKQNTISDLTTIREGATLGATSIQPNDNISRLVNNNNYISANNYPPTIFIFSLADGTTKNYEWNVKEIN